MGIRGLETFIKEKVQNGAYEINMERMIQSHKASSGQDALIVIDVEGMLQRFQPVEENLCGMRSQVYSARVRGFFQKLVDAGAKLVFFTDGPVQGDKQPTWFKRQNTKYNDHLAVIDKLEKHIPLKEIVDASPPSSTMVASLLRAVAKEFGPVTTSIHNECDLEIAAFATENNAYAVFADDSDFLIYSGKWRYWSIKNINLNFFTTIAYNKVALRSHLALSELQMPLFAALSGNDIVQFEDIKDFHQRIGWRDKFMNIAHYVKPLPLNLTDEVLENISQDVFSHKSNWKKYTSYLKNGCEIYKSESLTNQTNDDFMIKLINNGLKTVYGILKGITFSITCMYDDLRDTNRKSYPKLAFELRAKMVGIILKHANDPNLQTKVTVKLSHEEPYRMILLTPNYPEIEVPPLEKLLFPEEDDGLEPQRKKLFQWVLSGTNNNNLNIDRLFALPKEYICTVAVLYYLVKEANMSIIDADLILLSIYLTFDDASAITDDKPPIFLLKDAFTNVFLFLKMHGFLRRIFKAVGLKKYYHLVKFDGFAFHKLHQKWPVMEDAQQKHLLQLIGKFRLYID